MTKNELTIKQAKNGYVLELKFVFEDGEESEYIYVIDENVNEYDEKEFKTNDPDLILVGKLLVAVAEQLGLWRYNKYGDNNLRISFEKDIK